MNQENMKLPVLDQAVEALIVINRNKILFQLYFFKQKPQNYWKIFIEDPTKTISFDVKF